MTGTCFCDDSPTPVDGVDAGTPPADDIGFCPVTVTDNLDDLRGSTRGHHRLPRELEPVGSTDYDLTDR